MSNSFCYVTLRSCAKKRKTKTGKLLKPPNERETAVFLDQSNVISLEIISMKIPVAKTD